MNDEISLVMLLNKLQKAGDFEGFRKISYEMIDRILKRAPEDVLNLIAGMVGSMCRKLNVPEDEANEYISRIRGERKMGYFFENMEKMDIQEERRLRKEAQDRLSKAEDEFSKKLSEAQDEFSKKLSQAQNQAEEKIEQSRIEAYMEALRELSIERDEAKNMVMTKFGLDENQAEDRMKLYWK